MSEEDYEDKDPCRHPAPKSLCRLCDTPLEPDRPWIDWRWGDHDGCGYCGPTGHDTVQPFHIECVEALIRAGFSGPYMPDMPWTLEDAWLRPTLWRVVWDPNRIMTGDAELAHLIWTRIFGKDYRDYDPVTMNPFQAVDYMYDSREEFQKDMYAYGRCLGLTDSETMYLPLLLEESKYWGWEAPDSIRNMSREQLADHVRRMAENPDIRPWELRVVPVEKPDVWNLV